LPCITFIYFHGCCLILRFRWSVKRTGRGRSLRCYMGGSVIANDPDGRNGPVGLLAEKEFCWCLDLLLPSINCFFFVNPMFSSLSVSVVVDNAPHIMFPNSILESTVTYRLLWVQIPLAFHSVLQNYSFCRFVRTKHHFVKYVSSSTVTMYSVSVLIHYSAVLLLSLIIFMNFNYCLISIFSDRHVRL
jgi:hypothetical protein